MAAIIPRGLNPQVLDELGFCPESYDDFTQFDKPVGTHKVYTIALIIPDGCLMGVSFYSADKSECYSCPTIETDLAGSPDADDPELNKRNHIQWAKAAIDAAMPEPIGEQLELMAQ